MIYVATYFIKLRTEDLYHKLRKVERTQEWTSRYISYLFEKEMHREKVKDDFKIIDFDKPPAS